MLTKLLFNKRAIHNHKSNFVGVNGKELLRVYLKKTFKFSLAKIINCIVIIAVQVMGSN
jgi:hypothetical protein